MKTARFWHHHTAPVLLTLKEGESLRHHYSTPTDEGWNSETHIWSFNGRRLVHEWLSAGRDCDGLLEVEGWSYCEARNLKSGFVDEDGTTYPLWERGGETQRDYTAEAAGY